MGQITQTGKAEKSAEDVHACVTEECQSADIATYVLQSDTIGCLKADMADFARKVRFGNSAFKNWSLPKVEGSVNQTNKSVFTSRYVWSDMSLSEAVRYVIESGQFGEAVDELIRHYSDMPRETAEAIMSYNLFIVAKGWVAERQVSEMSGFSKLWESNDVAGQDFQKSDKYLQLKSFTFGLHDMSFDGNAEVVFYGWVGDTIVLSDDYTDVVAAIRNEYGVQFETVRDYEFFHDFPF